MRKVKLEILNGNLIFKEIIDESKITSIAELFDEYDEILNNELKMPWNIIH